MNKIKKYKNYNKKFNNYRKEIITWVCLIVNFNNNYHNIL